MATSVAAEPAEAVTGPEDLEDLEETFKTPLEAPLRRLSQELPSPSRAMEMDNLGAAVRPSDDPPTTAMTGGLPPSEGGPTTANAETHHDQAASEQEPSSDPHATHDPSGPVGPANFKPISAPAPAPEPTLNLVIMLTTGARHPYKIDERYLKSRKVTTEHMARSPDDGDGDAVFEPRELSGYQLKELIWTDWREEWQPRPASPSSIRLIVLGRMIEDKAVLKDFPFSLDKTNVVHMTVKPADLIEDDDTANKGSSKMSVLRARDGDDRGAGCRCVIL